MLLVYYIITALLALLVGCAPLERRESTVTMVILKKTEQQEWGLTPEQIGFIIKTSENLLTMLDDALLEMEKEGFENTHLYKTFLDRTRQMSPMAALF
jgi:hypothetical protein